MFIWVGFDIEVMARSGAIGRYIWIALEVRTRWQSGIWMGRLVTDNRVLYGVRHLSITVGLSAAYTGTFGLWQS